MEGYPINEVKKHCARFGEKFFQENGKKITLIKFGTTASKFTFTDDSQFQNQLKTLEGTSGGTYFAKPLRLLKDTIVTEDIKELLMVFLTDGENNDDS